MFRPLRLAAAIAAAGLACAVSAFAQTGSTSSLGPVPPDSAGFPTWRVEPARPCPSDSVWLVIDWCHACYSVLEATRTGTASARIVIEPTNTLGCPDSCPASHIALRFDTFPPGPNRIAIELITQLPGGQQTTRAFAEFTVRDSCGEPPPPPPQGLPYVNFVRFSGAHSPVPCPDDSIVVTVRGHFPDDCFVLRRVELQPIVCIRWPCLPILRILVDQTGCTRRPCAQQPTPFEAKVVMPPLPVGPYELWAELSVVSCSNEFPPAPDYMSQFQFAVVSPESCGGPLPPSSCMRVDWVQGSDRFCDAVIRDDRPVSLDLGVMTRVPLSAFQGKLRLWSDALRISSLELIGPAVGMTLGWTPTSEGADFLMFASSGAPIQPPVFEPSLPPPLVPVLRVEVAVKDGAHAPPVADLAALDVLASDSLGGAVYPCPEIATSLYPPRGVAHICADRECDANNDGRSDVRDIVLMLRCLNYQCADSSRFDCDDNGLFQFADVMCCARRILHRRPPDSTAARPAPEVSVALGALRQDEGGWSLPVTLRGVSNLGAAQLALGLPLDRFDVVGLGPLDSGVPWLGLHAMDGDALMLGLLNLTDPRALVFSPDQFTVDVRLALKPGQTAGGTFAITEGEFTDLEGAALDVRLPEPPAPATLALSAGRPNPFSFSTRFTLDLDRAAEVEVSVLDVSGRRIAQIHRGALPAGSHAMNWNGANESGGRATDGMYFIRASVNGRVFSSKVALLKSR